MKSHHLLSSTDAFLSVAALCVVAGLLYVGLQSLSNEDTYIIFRQKQVKTISK